MLANLVFLGESLIVMGIVSLKLYKWIMSWSYRIFKVAGIEVRVHVTFLLLLLFFGYVSYQAGGTELAVSRIAFILFLFGCVLLHEFGHAIAAKAYGIKTPDITLLPIGGVARLERMPDKPYQELIVALAGPLVNVVIAGVLFLFVGGRLQNISPMAMEGELDLAVQMLLVNIWLVLFNIIPAFPMDGGRVLRALLATRMKYARATQIAASIGQGIAFVFGVIGLIYNPMLIFIAIFIYMGASQEASLAQIREVSKGLPVSSAMVTSFETLDQAATLNDAVMALVRTSQHEFPVMSFGGEFMGLLTRPQMMKALKTNGGDRLVIHEMATDLPRVHENMSFDRAFQMMQECESSALPVFDSAGNLVGLLTMENVGEMMMINSVLAKGERPVWRKG